MHEAAFHWVASAVQKLGPFDTVIEIGSLNINGSVRDLFAPAKYVGIDPQDGDGVDVVCDALEYGPDHPEWIGHQVDCVVCCETLEHAQEWPEIVKKAMEWLDESGVLLITCAGPGRVPHSAVDGSLNVRDHEHYGNVSPSELARVLMPDFASNGCTDFGVQVRSHGLDTQAIARRVSD